MIFGNEKKSVHSTGPPTGPRPHVAGLAGASWWVWCTRASELVTALGALTVAQPARARWWASRGRIGGYSASEEWVLCQA
jgi:hypothetical protein